MWEILRVSDVSGFQLTVSTVSEPPQGDLGRAGAFEDSEINQRGVHDSINIEPQAPDPVMVRRCSPTSAPAPADCPPNLGPVSLYIDEYMTPSC